MITQLGSQSVASATTRLAATTALVWCPACCRKLSLRQASLVCHYVPSLDEHKTQVRNNVFQNNVFAVKGTVGSFTTLSLFV
jgi:hypothetical protein